mmetsp:Transcript_46010/g.114155  ORF Transcript_46010/g.114155 Transcript_46010/m.114155 type:complete len:304 (-) Transcript_46010:171-1082(-)
MVPVGVRLAVTGLSGRPELNGRAGVSISWDEEKGRVGVKLDTGERLLLKPDNVLVHGAAQGRPSRSIEERSLFSNMFARPGALSKHEADVVWSGTRLPRVFFDIEVDAAPFGRVVIELWPDRTPKSAENFRALCTGERGVSKSSRKRLCYRGSKFLRVLKGLALFGGDITKGDGKGGESIYGGEYEDLSCTSDGAPTHDRPGIVSMGWPGDKPPGDPEDDDPHKRTHLRFGSRFSIFLEADHHFDGRLPVIGVVVAGIDILAALSETPVNARKQPETKVGLTIDIKISDCGQLPDSECRLRDS